jgi:DNA polymerase-3 subunit gamma/tau
MRDAESMLDQLLAASGGQITEAGVRDLLGLADAEAVERLVAALADGDAVAGIAILDELEDRGRDLGIVLDQAVELVRTRLAQSFAGPPDVAATARLTRAARSLASIDPERRGVGGLRLQVELALFATPPGAAAIVAVPVTESTAAKPSARPEPMPGESPAPAGWGQDDAEPAPAGAAPARAPSHPAAPSSATIDPAPTASTSVPPPDEPAAEPAIAPPPPPPAARGSDLDRLLTGWPEIVASVRPATRAVITECRPLSVEGNAVTLGFPEAKAFLKDVAERKRADLEAAVGGFLGRAVSVRCVATNIDIVPPASGDDESGRIFAEAKRIFEDDLVDVGEVS